MKRISSAVLALGVGFASAAFGDALTFVSTNGDLGSTWHTYTLDGVSVTATAFNGGDLYAKYLGANEDGLGLADDPSGKHEIFVGLAGAPTPFVQLDMSKLLKAGFTNFQFMMSSTTEGQEMWQVSACPTGGTVCSNAQSLKGSNETLHAVPANLSAADPFLDIRMAPGATGNVALNKITATSPTAGGLSSGGGVPEPASLGLLALGLAGIGFRGRRRRKA